MKNKLFSLFFMIFVTGFLKIEALEQHNSFCFVRNKSQIKQICSRDLQEGSFEYEHCKNIQNFLKTTHDLYQAKSNYSVALQNRPQTPIARLFELGKIGTIDLPKIYFLEKELESMNETINQSFNQLSSLIPSGALITRRYTKCRNGHFA